MRGKNTIGLILENCEAYYFDRKDVDVYLDGLNKHYIGENEYNTVEHCVIIFHDSKENPIKPIVFDDFQDKDWWKRISGTPDITQIHINDEIYFVKWSGDEWNNEYQTHSRSGGNKVIVISKTRKYLNDF